MGTDKELRGVAKLGAVAGIGVGLITLSDTTDRRWKDAQAILGVIALAVTVVVWLAKNS